jgi:hypothetical protein
MFAKQSVRHLRDQIEGVKGAAQQIVFRNLIRPAMLD